MRLPNLTLVFILAITIVFANICQAQNTKIKFKITRFHEQGKTETETREISVSDLQGPYGGLSYLCGVLYIGRLPNKFIDYSRKNRTDTVWHDPSKPKNDYQNQGYIYVYNSLGQLIKYSYLGCLICNTAPYTFVFHYNTSGQIDQIGHSILNAPPFFLFKISYDVLGNIRQIDEVSKEQTLETRIIRID